LKRLFLFTITYCTFAASLSGAPAAITDLQINDAATGFRHVGLVWTVPYDAAASTTPSRYEIRLSTSHAIVSESDWNTNSGLTSYPYRVAWSTAGVVAGEKNAQVVTGLTDGQDYYFAIKSSTDNVTWSAIDTASRSSMKPFNTVPSMVSGHNYISDVIVTMSTPTLSWNVPSAGGVDETYGDHVCSYTVELSRYYDFSEKIEKAGITTNSWITSPLTENVSYYWRVKAGDVENGYSATYINQDGRSFYVNAHNEAPAAFTLISPINSNIVQTWRPTFQWNASSDPDPGDTFTYTLYYSTDAAFALAVTTSQPNIADTPTPQYQPGTDLQENATYYWKIFAVDSNSRATMSTSTGTVRINKNNVSPLSFTPLDPGDGTRALISTPTLSWQATSDPDPGDTFAYSVLYSSSDETLSPGCTEIIGLTTTQYVMPTLQEDATYWWRVQAIDAGGPATRQTSIWKFLVDAVHGQPAAFNLVSSSGIVAIPRPPFIWSPSSEAGGDTVSYTLYYSTAVDFSVATASSGLAAVQYTPASDLSENTSYYWKVRAGTAYNQYRVSNQTWTVIIDAVPNPPQAFHLASPVNAAAVTYLRPTLDWEDTIEPDPSDSFAGYTLFYSTVADYSVQNQVTGIAVSSYTFPAALTDGTTYYWKVRALSAMAKGTFSTEENWRFVAVNQAPGAFNATSPTGLVSASTVTFNWATSFDPENDAVSYSVYYSSYSDFRTLVSSTGLTSTHCTLSPFEENKTYYWYVAAIDSWNHSRASAQTLSFSVNAVNEPPHDFSLVAPANGTRVTTTLPQFIWQATVDPDPGDTVSYTLWYSPDANFQTKTAVTGLTTPAYSLTSTLNLNTTCYWRVYAVGSDGLQTASPSGSFFVAQVLQLPASASFVATLGAGKKIVALTWAAVTKNIDGTALGETAGYRVYKSYDFDGLFTGSPYVSLSTGTLQWTDDDARSLPVYYLIKAYTPSGAEGCASLAQRVAADSETMNYTDDRGLVVTYRPQTLTSGDVAITRVSEDEKGGVICSYAIAVTQGGRAVSGFTFTEPVTIAFKLPQAAGAASRAPSQNAGYAVYWFNGVEWVNLGGQAANGQMSVTTPYTGRYQLRAASRAESFSVLKAWPKIITPNGDGVNDEFNFTFENSAGDRVDGKIFDLAGSLAGRMASKNDFWLSWDGRDDAGAKAPSGVYLYQVTVGKAVYNGTVVVAR